MLDGFEIGRFAFHFTAQESGYLPEYKGSTLRGGFGHTFRDVVCPYKGRDCGSCGSKDNCAYSYVFETSPNRAGDTFCGYSDVPRPFVVEPQDNGKRRFASGDPLEFHLVLIGKAIEHFPYFAFCFEELGKKGLGKGRTRFRLERASVFDFRVRNWIPAYNPNDHFLSDDLPTITGSELWDDNSGNHASSDKTILSLHFITPTRIKYRDKLVSDLEFHVMIRNLLRRISMLMLFHCGKSLDIRLDNLITQAKMVDVHKWDLRWKDWFRYSNRQEAHMNLGGFVGTAAYVGDLGAFMPAIALGEQIHVGKSTTFGLGKYCINE